MKQHGQVRLNEVGIVPPTPPAPPPRLTLAFEYVDSLSQYYYHVIICHVTCLTTETVSTVSLST